MSLLQPKKIKKVETLVFDSLQLSDVLKGLQEFNHQYPHATITDVAQLRSARRTDQIRVQLLYEDYEIPAQVLERLAQERKDLETAVSKLDHKHTKMTKTLRDFKQRLTEIDGVLTGINHNTGEGV